MAESVNDLLSREHEYLRNRDGRDFFLALGPYAETLHGNRRIRRYLDTLGRAMREASIRFIDEQRAFVDEAKLIRHELAERAPEIDNSNMERPDETSHAFSAWELDSFAGFDDTAQMDVSSATISYPPVPRDSDDPGPVSRLLGILRGRLHAAQYGEDVPRHDQKMRRDLDDLAIRIRNLDSRQAHTRRRYRQESRTLPGLAFARLVHFGLDLNPEPTIIETDEDLGRWLDRSIREWGSPRRVVQKLVAAEPMEDWERVTATETEQFLKGELDRLHQELMRRVPADRLAASLRFVQEQTGRIIVGVIVSVATAVVVAAFFWVF